MRPPLGEQLGGQSLCAIVYTELAITEKSLDMILTVPPQVLNSVYALIPNWRSHEDEIAEQLVRKIVANRSDCKTYCIALTAKAILSGSLASPFTRSNMPDMSSGTSDRKRMSTLSFASRYGKIPSSTLSAHFS